jgi:hypothetical protein
MRSAVIRECDRIKDTTVRLETLSKYVAVF